MTCSFAQLVTCRVVTPTGEDSNTPCGCRLPSLAGTSTHKRKAMAAQSQHSTASTGPRGRKVEATIHKSVRAVLMCDPNGDIASTTFQLNEHAIAQEQDEAVVKAALADAKARGMLDGRKGRRSQDYYRAMTVSHDALYARPLSGVDLRLLADPRVYKDLEAQLDARDV